MGRTTNTVALMKDFLVLPAVLRGMIDQSMKVVMAKTETKLKAAHFCHSACQRSPGRALTSSLGQPDVEEDDHRDDVHISANGNLALGNLFTMNAVVRMKKQPIAFEGRPYRIESKGLKPKER